jgi:hypothetical protein
MAQRPALFWIITQRIVVIPYRRFGRNLSGPIFKGPVLIYFAKEAWNHVQWSSFPQNRSGLGNTFDRRGSIRLAAWHHCFKMASAAAITSANRPPVDRTTFEIASWCNKERQTFDMLCSSQKHRPLCVCLCVCVCVCVCVCTSMCVTVNSLSPLMIVQ